MVGIGCLVKEKKPGQKISRTCIFKDDFFLNTILNQVRSIFCSFRAVSHSAGCNPALCATALDVIPRYLTQRRITSRVVAHSAGWNPNVSDFILRCCTQRRMSLRAIAHSTGCHLALLHIAQDFIPRCRIQRRISSPVVANCAGCHSVANNTLEGFCGKLG